MVRGRGWNSRGWIGWTVEGEYGWLEEEDGILEGGWHGELKGKVVRGRGWNCEGWETMIVIFTRSGLGIFRFNSNHLQAVYTTS